MKHNIILGGGINWMEDVATLCGMVQKRNPSIMATANFEQVLAMVKDDEVDKICIYMGTSTIEGDDIAKAIHAINKDIPILIWNSIMTNKDQPNELYLDSGDFKDDSFWEVFDKFYIGGLEAVKVN